MKTTLTEEYSSPWMPPKRRTRPMGSRGASGGYSRVRMGVPCTDFAPVCSSLESRHSSSETLANFPAMRSQVASTSIRARSARACARARAGWPNEAPIWASRDAPKNGAQTARAQAATDRYTLGVIKWKLATAVGALVLCHHRLARTSPGGRESPAPLESVRLRDSLSRCAILRCELRHCRQQRPELAWGHRRVPRLPLNGAGARLAVPGTSPWTADSF